MIKSISFRKEFIPLIKSGKKTITRRVKTNLKENDICYFKASRNGKKEGYIKILRINDQLLRNGILGHATIKDDIEEIGKEGIYSITPLIDFMTIWDKLNKEGYEWADNPEVYRIEFKYLGEKLELLK